MRPKKDTRKYHVVRVKGFTETVLNTFDDEGAALDDMNRYGKRTVPALLQLSRVI